MHVYVELYKEVVTKNAIKPSSVYGKRMVLILSESLSSSCTVQTFAANQQIYNIFYNRRWPYPFDLMVKPSLSPVFISFPSFCQVNLVLTFESVLTVQVNLKVSPNFCCLSRISGFPGSGRDPSVKHEKSSSYERLVSNDVRRQILAKLIAFSV